MNFTREPIIETIITPKEGCKLLVRSSKAEGQEEYTADAVEVVSFGQALFFRSLERPKPFLVPIGDYEVVEVKEARAVLKNAQFERTIKIGGGREPAPRREPQEAPEEAQEEGSAEEESSETAPVGEGRFERRRDRHRRRRRRAHEEREDMQGRVEKEGAPASEKPPSEPSSTTFSSLIPPPTTLISETIGRYKEQYAIEPKTPPEEEPKQEKKEEGDPNSLSRVSIEAHSTFISPLSDWTNIIS